VDVVEAVEIEGQDLRDALHNLARLSLLTIDPAPGEAGVRVHGLVQRGCGPMSC
jgi:hypothetical protein